jgi:AcrR family transcriptional regulator
MEVQDRRVRRTQQLLAKALIALTLEKGYEAVTIRDITERADVGYATFFRHYRDKDDLLQDVMDVVLAEFIELLPTARSDDPTTIGVLLFRHVQEQSEMVRVLLRSHTLLPRLIEAATKNVLSDHKVHSDGVVPPEIASYHIVTSTIALIHWWLEHGMPYPPEQMGRIYYELIERPTSEVAFS